MDIPYPKGGSIVWTFVKDNMIEEISTAKILDCVDLIINYLRKRRIGGVERYYTIILI